MRIYILNTIGLIFIILLSSGCRQNSEKNPSTSMAEAKKNMEKINKVLVDKDKEKIEAYIERRKINGMKENNSGLYYLIWGESKGPKVKTGNIVILDFNVSLLDGTLCYSSKDSEPKKFQVGQGGVESGLEMAVLLMHKGEKGKFIMPPHLGHGLLGDNEKIPPLATLVYDVEILDVIEY
ncbi:MAG: FKBP-type peptidyl-prolyl cis-trans isomerase [Bacteroidales bacterium]